MTAAGVPATDDSGRTWGCPGCGHAKAGHDGRGCPACNCGYRFVPPTPARPGTADELREELLRWLLQFTGRDEETSDADRRWLTNETDEVLRLPAVQRLLAVEREVRGLHRPFTQDGTEYCEYDAFVWPCTEFRALGGAS